MLPLAHYSDLVEQCTDPSRDTILSELAPNMLVLGVVTSRRKDSVEILLEQAFATSKVHLHQIADFKIYVKLNIGLLLMTVKATVDSEDLDIPICDVRSGDKVYGTLSRQCYV
jgi:hypothetical protein